MAWNKLVLTYHFSWVLWNVSLICQNMSIEIYLKIVQICFSEHEKVILIHEISGNLVCIKNLYAKITVLLNS